MAVSRQAAAGLLGFILAGPVWGDDLTGENEFLCAAANVIICLDDGTCTSAAPWDVNVPQFINVEL